MEYNEIYNMDCIKGMQSIEDKSIDMVLTDIPYGEVNRAKESGLRKLKKGVADELTFELEDFLFQVDRVCKGSIYIFCGMEQISLIRKFFREKDMMTRVCVYKKTNPSPMNSQFTWMSDVEFCVYAKNKSAVFNGKYKSCVWEFPAGHSKVHPTQKNIDLFKYLIAMSTKESDIVLDPCIGSGTTADACQQLNRKYIGFELNEEYYKYATERLATSKRQLKMNFSE